MYCTACGAKIEDTVNYCPDCGHETPRGAEKRHATQDIPRRLYRSTSDKVIGGVCSGLAKYMNVDPTLVRLAVVAGLIFSFGLALVAYIAAWIIIPAEPYWQVPARSASTPADTAT